MNECEEGSIVEGTIRNAVKGGFIVDAGVMLSFLFRN